MRSLLSRATPGPWTVLEESQGYPNDAMIWIEELELPIGSEMIPTVRADADLIAAARMVLPAALDVIEAARALAGTTHGNVRGPKYAERRASYLALRAALDRFDA